ncbi:pyrophosphatase PpaX [Oceanobacillus chungangensis]|uniref:Pyrophosphatase PpaX n=1 Tax=Oceanobacillus chungangensis TaxID=1229152 RepID=A0A3D8PJ62_9BACI|nr:pyrophosphatase PpaX [Oceanobacillus chungangensis]RDW15692.1 pyrophosphatase PpaX [Oceanobacillus chungangensis]
MNIDTVLFDLDGTLIDTNQLIIDSFKYTFDHYQLSFTEEEIIEFNGPPLIDTFHKIDPERVDEMIAKYREHNITEHDKYVKAFPLVRETLEELKKNDIRLAIVTTKMKTTALKGLALTGLDSYFDTIITLDDVTHPKPHPEPVVKAMQALDAEASRTLMVGDNSHDIESGNNAGVLTAGVAWSRKGKERLLAHHPTYLLEDMRDLLTIVGV